MASGRSRSATVPPRGREHAVPLRPLRGEARSLRVDRRRLTPSSDAGSMPLARPYAASGMPRPSTPRDGDSGERAAVEHALELPAFRAGEGAGRHQGHGERAADALAKATFGSAADRPRTLVLRS